jgi:hypothetical protein
VVDHLVRAPAVVLEQVPVDGAGRARDALGDAEDLGEGVVGDVGELDAVVLGDDQL